MTQGKIVKFVPREQRDMFVERQRLVFKYLHEITAGKSEPVLINSSRIFEDAFYRHFNGSMLLLCRAIEQNMRSERYYDRFKIPIEPLFLTGRIKEVTTFDKVGVPRGYIIEFTNA